VVFPCPWNKAAEALKIPGKPPGMSGLLARGFGLNGRYQDVLDYVTQDVRITSQLPSSADQTRKFQWLTRKGTKSTMDFAPAAG